MSIAFPGSILGDARRPLSAHGVLRVVEVGERRDGAVQDAAAGWEGMEARVRWGA